MSRDFALHPQLVKDTVVVGELGLCCVRLMNDTNYPWLVLVPRVDAARELIDLDEAQQVALLRDITTASRALQTCFAPDKLNVAALGNMVPQLHIHVVARYTDDVAWPAPVWGRAPAVPYDELSLADRIAQLRGALESA